MPKAPSTTIAEKVRLVAEHLVALAPEQIMTYAELNRLVGPGSTYVLSRARSVANKETGALFAPVYRVGIKRLQSDQAPAVGLSGMHRIRGLASRTSRQLVNAVTRANDMSNEAVIASYAQLTTLGLIQNMAHHRAVTAKVSEIYATHNGNTEAAVAASMELMRAHRNRAR